MKEKEWLLNIHLDTGASEFTETITFFYVLIMLSLSMCEIYVYQFLLLGDHVHDFPSQNVPANPAEASPVRTTRFEATFPRTPRRRNYGTAWVRRSRPQDIAGGKWHTENGKRHRDRYP